MSRRARAGLGWLKRIRVAPGGSGGSAELPEFSFTTYFASVLNGLRAVPQPRLILCECKAVVHTLPPFNGFLPGQEALQ